MYSSYLSLILRFLDGDFFVIVNSRMINANTENSLSFYSKLGKFVRVLGRLIRDKNIVTYKRHD